VDVRLNPLLNFFMGLLGGKGFAGFARLRWVCWVEMDLLGSLILVLGLPCMCCCREWDRQRCRSEGPQGGLRRRTKESDT
jgi:hypothetical protein